MDVVKLLAVILVLSNFYYFVYPENRNIRNRFWISLASIVLLSLVFCLSAAQSMKLAGEGVVIITGYYLILFCAHLLIIKVFKVRKYIIYQLVFAVLFLVVTMLYTALVQDIFRFS